MPAPIALFAYDRPDHLRQTLEALSRNHLAAESDLFVFADGPKAGSDDPVLQRIRRVRALLCEPWPFRTISIRESHANKGLAASVIAGVTELVNAQGRVIVLEDDLITSPGFLTFMNWALETYVESPSVFQVSGYQFPLKFTDSTPTTFFLPMITSWGWATWKRAWDEFDPNATGWESLRQDPNLRHRFDLDGSYPYTRMLERQMEGDGISSWAIRWRWSVFQHGGLVLYSKASFVRNIGFDRLATHTKSGSRFEHSSLQEQDRYSSPESEVVDEVSYIAVKSWLAQPESRHGRLARIAGSLRRLLASSS